MKLLDKYLVGFGIWLTGLYLLGLLLSWSVGLEEVWTRLLFTVWTLFFIVLGFPVKLPKINWWASSLLVLGLVLTLPLALIGDHIMGADAHREYYCFVQTDIANEIFVRSGYLITGCLSITLLPTFFQDITGVEHETLFRLLYPCVFSVFPVVIYSLCRFFTKSLYAFAAGVVVALQPLFIWTTASARTSMGTLFIALVLLVLLCDIKGWQKSILVTVLGIGCLLSHYTSAFVMLAILVGALVPKTTRWPTILPLILLAFGTHMWLNHVGLNWITTRYF